MTIDISLGCKAYPWIEPLVDGRVEPADIDLTVVTDRISPEYFSGLLDRGEFDAAELSISAYFAAMDHPDYHVSALPVFPHRRFRHSFVYVRQGSDIESPSDLNGRTVGLVNWQFAAGLWARGVLGERHGVDLASVDWRTASSNPVSTAPPAGFSVSDLGPLPESSGEGAGDTLEDGGSGALKTLERRLAAGDLDAAITPTEYRNDSLTRLFDDPFEVERTYYTETGVFPINHLVGVSDDVLADHPWVAGKVYEAFEAALEQTLSEVREPGWFKRSPLVWGLESLETQLSLFDGTPWEHGLTERNRRTLEKAIEYAARQGILRERVPVEDLFVDGVGW